MTRILFFIVAALMLASTSGCMERQLAPELPSSPDEVEQIKEKIDTFEW